MSPPYLLSYFCLCSFYVHSLLFPPFSSQPAAILKLQIISWRFCGFDILETVVAIFSLEKITGGEIDTKPIDSVRNALSLFGDKGDDKKYQPTGSKNECEKELEGLTKELANCKVQLEAKQAAHMQALLKLEHSQKKAHELSTLLKNSDIERNKYMNECAEGRARIEELESKMKEMAEQNLETAKVRDQLSHVLSELKATQRELLNKEKELVAARDSEMYATTNAEQLENALKIEKEQKQELLQQVKELNDVLQRSKLAAINADKGKDEKIDLATKATDQAQKQLEGMGKQIEMLQGLQNQLMNKSTNVDSASNNAINNSNQLHIELELKERKIMDQSVYIEAIEMELNQLKQELKSAKEEINDLNMTIESLAGELQKSKAELNMNKERDTEAQVEIALLKSQLQEHRLAYENGGYVAENPSKEIEAKERNNKNNKDSITISLEEYKYLVREAEKSNKVQGSVTVVGSHSELALMKNELKNASVKIVELRARAEQALSRAELAENAKAALEDKIRRHREHRQKRKAAMTALREVSTPEPFSPSTSQRSDRTPKTYQPLGKVLNMRL